MLTRTFALVAVAAVAVAATDGPGRHVEVPGVVGAPEAVAVKRLARRGLVANVRYEKSSARTGSVLHAAPAAGHTVARGSVVLLTIAPPRSGARRDVHALSAFVDAHPRAFVGLYLDGDGGPHVVFAPGVDRAVWRARLDAAARGVAYRTATCGRSRARLEAVKDEVAAKRWTSRRAVAFAVDVDPATCTVRIESDALTKREIAALARRFGTTISLDTTRGSHPTLVPG